MTDLLVFIEGRLAGEIAAGAGNAAEFCYENDYLEDPSRTPLSVCAPLGHGRYQIGRWLDNLLPDNVAVRRRWAARNSAPTARPADLLGTPIGLDCAGAVQFCRPGDEAALLSRAGGLEPCSDHDVAEWIRRARKDWSAWEGPGSRGQFSLAGAQAKCALHWDGAGWHAPYGNVPTTHILKPGVEQHTDAEVVEHVCMAAARRLGIETAATELLHFESERVVSVTRFDRVNDGGALRRRHNEDACQALDLDPEQKYQVLGGPTPEQMATLLRQESTDAPQDVWRFCDALIYSWAIAAPDAHAKNYSLVLDRTDVQMSPLYDVISYLPYTRGGALGLRTAMAFGDDHALGATAELIARGTAAQALGLHPAAVSQRAAELVSAAPSAISDAIDGLSPEDRQSRALLPLLRSAEALSQQLLSALARTQ